MNPFSKAKSCMWICRLIPLVTFTLTLAISLFLDLRQQDTVHFVLVVIGVAPYLVLVYFVIPHLLYPGEHREPNLAYFFFTALTAGLGPVIWYWVSVDPILRRKSTAAKMQSIR